MPHQSTPVAYISRLNGMVNIVASMIADIVATSGLPIRRIRLYRHLNSAIHTTENVIMNPAGSASITIESS